jgi:hypothetical protein
LVLADSFSQRIEAARLPGLLAMLAGVPVFYFFSHRRRARALS